ncbi:MAG: type 2 isopentenyl-diphosphate Delta-isomerase [Clostridia bacterium]|nr:type 2 isopentenyl-diphosphate Delta-isomerase [Clostridia bacterium]
MTLREERKLAHLHYAVALGDAPGGAGWDDIRLINLSVPEVDRKEVSTVYEWWGKRLRLPLLINAMTGGTPLSGEINEALARAAREAGVAMAVGSQQAALDNPAVVHTYTVVRRHNPDGVILANLSARATPEEAARACEMLAADALQLHLNVAQELAMPEGERAFRGLVRNIAAVVQAVAVPVIVKEVGFGLSREAATLLYGAGVRWLDTGGRGGTDFLAIEQERSGVNRPHLRAWGLPGAVSLAEVRQSGLPVRVIASGGIRSALDLARALALGAELAGVAGFFLRLLQQSSWEEVARVIKAWEEELKDVMVMTGCRTLPELRRAPLVVTGETREWLEMRGLNPARYAQR